MKIALLDVYPRRSYRVTKDSNGGFGTANDYGDKLVARILSRVVAASLDWPPLYSVYVAGVLRARGHEVTYTRDEEVARTADLVVLISSIVAHETELAAVRHLREAGKVVGVIGPFGSAVSQPYLLAGAAVIRGEPESFFQDSEFHARIKAAQGSMLNADMVANLDGLDMPAWDIIRNSHPMRMRVLGQGVSVPISSSRGCPYSCFNYCTYPLQQGRKLRLRDPGLVAAEMVHWQDRIGASTFVFRDPVFGLNRLHAIDLARHILATKRRFSFIIEAHLKNLDDEVIELLKAAGLSLVYTGIESVTEEVIKDAHRFSIEFKEQTRRVRKLENEGVRVKTMFMFGFPKDTEETCRASIDAALYLRPSFAQFSVFTPYPGTPIFEQYRERLTTSCYEDFTQWQLVFRHDHLLPGDIRRLLDEAYRRFYARLPWVFSTLRHSIAA